MVLNKAERTETYISIASLTAAAAIFTGGLLFESRPYHRMFLSGSAIALSGAGVVLSKTRGEQARRYNQLAINSQWEKAMILAEHSLEDAYRKLHPRAAREMDAEIVEEMPALPESQQDGNFYNWDNLPDDAAGIIVAGGTGYGKSTVTKWIIGKITAETPSVVKLYDGHGIENNWEKDIGVKAEVRFPNIEAGLIEAETELDARREDSSRRTPWIIVCDELGASFDNFEDPKRIKKIIRRLGSEGRKFNLTAILINQSNNCEAMGIDKNYRANFTLVSLGEMAREQFKKGTPERQTLDATAYPCCVSGNIPLKMAHHPTHSHHTEFKKKGKKPANLLPVRLLQEEPSGDRIQPPHIDLEKTDEPREENNPIKTLEALILNDSDLPASLLSEAEWELFGLANSAGSLSVRDAQRSPTARREGWDSVQIQSIFSKFSEMGLGEIVRAGKGSIEFKVNGGNDD